MFKFPLPDNVLAFTTSRQCEGGKPGVDARELGIHEANVHILPTQLVIPRQTHTNHVAYADASHAGPLADTDAVFTDVPNLCVAVKTADCIPVLLYDARQRLVAAIHAGWRGTVGRIVTHTMDAMQSRGADLHAIIGPGISLDAFEVGDEVYDAFFQAGFPMDRIAQRFPINGMEQQLPIQSSTNAETATNLPGTPNTAQALKWHLDLWEANRWLLLEAGIPPAQIQVSGICTYSNLSQLYSARQESIRTGRNLNGIMLPQL